jgi:hypothetical protein
VECAGDSLRIHPYFVLREDDLGFVLRQYRFFRRLRLAAPEEQDQEETVHDTTAQEDLQAEIREGVRDCLHDGSHAKASAALRKSAETPTDYERTFAPLLAEIHKISSGVLCNMVLRHFVESSDSSVHGLVNSVAAAARDSGNASVRWRLESLAGTLLLPTPSGNSDAPVTETVEKATA